MVFTHDTEVSLQTAVSLANSLVEPNSLATVADLDAFCATYDFTGRRDHDQDELTQVRELRPRLRSLLASSRDEAVTMVNAMLAEARAVPQLVRHDPYDWHIHAISSDAPLAQRILVDSAMAMIDVIRRDEMSRLTICADADCESIVLDLSRNRSRRYCSTTCGNRNAVAAYRARRAAETN